jgi:DNA-binding IclR family transcriptional regulator
MSQNSDEVLTYETGKPVWRRLFKLAKSFLESLIKAVKETSKLRYLLDFIMEYIDCIDAAVSHRQSAEEVE